MNRNLIAVPTAKYVVIQDASNYSDRRRLPLPERTTVAFRPTELNWSRWLFDGRATANHNYIFAT